MSVDIEYFRPSSAAEQGADTWLDHLATVLNAISYRRLTPEQLDRFACLLQQAEMDALSRAKGQRRREREVA